ncbi:MAG: DUF4290 domain-containing protein [Bacteroidales bacterium]
MDYNTQLNKLALPEYGRHIQRMVEHIKAIPDREKRNEQAHAVIAVMGNLFPYLRDINDFKHKLWDHLFLIADFDLDIDSPYPKPSIQVLCEKPNVLQYSLPQEIKKKHYGRAIQTMVKAVAELTDDASRNVAAMVLANHMKKAYLIWSKDTVTDDIIYKDLSLLSGGKISIDSQVRLQVGNYSTHTGSASENAKRRPRNPHQKRKFPYNKPSKSRQQ